MIAHRRRLAAALALLLLAVAGACWWVWERNGAYGFHVLARRGGTYWITVHPDDPRLSPAMRAALAVPPPPATSGPMTWQERENGFEVAELPVMAGGRESTASCWRASIPPATASSCAMRRPATRESTNGSTRCRRRA